MKHPDTTNHTPVYLEPGMLHAGRRPTVVQTVLGSCIAVTMHAPRLKSGAICHAQLPDGTAHKPGELVGDAIRLIFNKMLALGAQQNELVVKLFGGSRVLGNGNHDPKTKAPIGEQNIEQAIHQLQQLGLEITSSDTGGDTGRKLFFYTDSGDVFVRKQRSSPAKRNASYALQET